MAAAGTSGFSKMEERGYFLLLDRLQCTLEDKIDILEYDWRKPETVPNLGHVVSGEGREEKTAKEGLEN